MLVAGRIETTRFQESLRFTTMNNLLVNATNLKKSFGDTHAVDGVSLEAVSYTHLTLPTIYSV